MLKFYEQLKSSKEFLLDDKAKLFKNAVDNYTDFCSWEEIEYSINRPSLFNFELIDKIENKDRIEIPREKLYWGNNETQHSKFISKAVNDGNGLIILRWEDANQNTFDMCEMLEKVFDVCASAHVYCGLEEAKSFNIHTDYPSNFILQVFGKTRWKVYKNRLSSLIRSGKFILQEKDLEIDFDVVLEPGDIIYVPSKMYHIALPDSPRISISFPCQSDMFGKKQNRTFYRINYPNGNNFFNS